MLVIYVRPSFDSIRLMAVTNFESLALANEDIAAIDTAGAIGTGFQASRKLGKTGAGVLIFAACISLALIGLRM